LTIFLKRLKSKLEEKNINLLWKRRKQKRKRAVADRQTKRKKKQSGIRKFLPDFYVIFPKEALLKINWLFKVAPKSTEYIIYVLR